MSRRFSCPRLAPALIAVLVTMTAVAGQDDGAVAPANTWYTTGGCASLTGVSATRPLKRQPRMAWTREFEGDIEGDVLAWDDRVVVTTRVDAKLRRLHLLDLLDGEPVVPPRDFKTNLPLEASIWKHRILVRSAPDRLDVFVVGRRERLIKDWGRRGKADFGPPTLFGDEIYVVEGGACCGCEGDARRTSGRQRVTSSAGRRCVETRSFAHRDRISVTSRCPS